MGEFLKVREIARVLTAADDEYPVERIFAEYLDKELQS